MFPGYSIFSNNLFTFYLTFLRSDLELYVISNIKHVKNRKVDAYTTDEKLIFHNSNFEILFRKTIDVIKVNSACLKHVTS